MSIHVSNCVAISIVNCLDSITEALFATQNLVEFSTLATALFAEDGHDAICAVMFISDADPTETLFACAAGQVLVDIMAE